MLGPRKTSFIKSTNKTPIPLTASLKKDFINTIGSSASLKSVINCLIAGPTVSRNISPIVLKCLAIPVPSMSFPASSLSGAIIAAISLSAGPIASIRGVTTSVWNAVCRVARLAVNSAIVCVLSCRLSASACASFAA